MNTELRDLWIDARDIADVVNAVHKTIDLIEAAATVASAKANLDALYAVADSYKRQRVISTALKDVTRYVSQYLSLIAAKTQLLETY